MLLADGMLQQWGDLVAIAIVIAMALVGLRSGLFVATLWGLSGLVAVMAGLAGLDRVSEWLRMADVTPVYVPVAAFLTVAVAIGLGLRVAVGGFVQEDEVRFPPLIDAIGGVAVGGLAGMIVAGGLQIALSMMPLPAWAGRLDPRRQIDFGTPLIRSFARWAEPDAKLRGVLLDGEPGRKYDPTEDAKPAATPQEDLERKLNPWKNSEVFADLNLNGTREDDEPFEDADGDGKFSTLTSNNDTNGNRFRDVGLLERYRLGPWLTVAVGREVPPKRDGDAQARPEATLAQGQPVAPPPPPAVTPVAPAPLTPAPVAPAPPTPGEKRPTDKVVIRVTAASAFDAEGLTERLSKELGVVGSTWARSGDVTVITLPFGGKLKDVVAAITAADVGLVSQTDPATRTISVVVE